VTSILDEVRAGYDAGLCLLPVCEDGSKKPDVSTWTAFQTTRPTRTQMRDWDFAHRSGYGVIAGAVSGNVVAVDFDCDDTYAALIDGAPRCGMDDFVVRVADGYEDQTPGGGRRWLVHLPADVEWRDCTLAQRPGRAGEPPKKTLIELPTFNILAPSNGLVHPSQKPYQRLSGGFDTIATCTRDEWEAFLDYCRSFDEMPRREAGPPRSPSSSTGTRPGDAYNQRMTWPALLEPHGWTHVYNRGEIAYWRRPEKLSGISATTNYGGSDLFYPFTSSTAFDREKSYSKFAAYAVFEHGGDFSAAARQLAAEGYGSRPVASPCPTSRSWPSPLGPAAFHGVFGDLVRVIAPSTEADPAGLLLQLVTLFGNLIGRHAYWLAEADRHFGNLFVLLVGETSKGRKGTSFGHLRRLFQEIDEAWMKTERDGLSTGEGIIWAIRDPIYKHHLVKKKGEIVRTQHVQEDPGIVDKRLLVVQAEFASTLKVLTREGNTLSPVLRKAWDALTLQILTKNSAATASHPLVSLIGHITITELQRELTELQLANGFANRFLYCLVRRSQLLPHGAAVPDLSGWVLSVAAACRHAERMSLMTRDDAAAALWAQVYPRLSTGRPGLFGAVTARAEAQVMRLALLYALADCAEAIERVHLEAALEVWRYCFDSAAYIFGTRLGDATADRILEALREAGTEGLRRLDIYKLFDGHKSTAEIERALNLLATYGLAQKDIVETGGRPSERWKIC
jgi:hypothetical protein